jgi:hypothetical protein
MAATSSILWDRYIGNSISNIQDAKLERVLRPLVPDGSSAVQVWTVQLQQPLGSYPTSVLLIVHDSI